MQIFEYANTSAAEVEAKRISASGASVGTSMMSWMATPHFYRKDNLIALYVGGNAAITEALEASLGAQFAGG